MRDQLPPDERDLTAFDLTFSHERARARALTGEDEARLHMIGVWRETRNFFTEREQAALALTEAATLVSRGGGVPDDDYARAARHFDESELAHVLALILAINTWNRVALSTAKVAGEDERATR